MCVNTHSPFSDSSLSSNLQSSLHRVITTTSLSVKSPTAINLTGCAPKITQKHGVRLRSSILFPPCFEWSCGRKRGNTMEKLVSLLLLIISMAFASEPAKVSYMSALPLPLPLSLLIFSVPLLILTIFFLLLENRLLIISQSHFPFYCQADNSSSSDSANATQVEEQQKEHEELVSFQFFLQNQRPKWVNP